MLPTPKSISVDDGRLLVCIPNSEAMASRFFGTIGQPLVHSGEIASKYKISQVATNVSLIWLTADACGPAIIEASDGALFIVSAVEGISTELIASWQLCIDNNIPRHLIITDLYAGYADFVEMVAIATRTLQTDLAVRYLPMASDDADSMAGIFDVLTTSIWDFSTSQVVIRDAEQQHADLTKDDRTRLMDAIAIASFSDDDLAVHQSGLLLPTEAYVHGWTSTDLHSISPLEGTAGIEFISEWIDTLPARWAPVVTNSPTEISQRFGIGIDDGIARMWGETGTKTLYCSPAFDSEHVDREEIQRSQDVIASCLLHDSIRLGYQVVPANQEPPLIAPIFAE